MYPVWTSLLFSSTALSSLLIFEICHLSYFSLFMFHCILLKTSFLVMFFDAHFILLKMVFKVCSEGYSQREEVLRQVRCIIDEMGHDFTMGPARSLAFIVIKILKQIFDRIYVNIEGMEKVGEFYVYIFVCLFVCY